MPFAEAGRRRLPPEQRRAQLLGCALAVFAERGLGRAGHTEIARTAGVAVSTVFLYFPSRDELVSAVLDEVERHLVGMAEQVHGQAAPAPDLLAEHGRRFRASIDTHPHHARIWLDWSTAFREGIWPRYLAFSDKLVNNHQRTIERGQREGSISPDVDAEAAAHILIGAAHMVARMKLAGVEPEQLQRISRAMLQSALGPSAQRTDAAPR